METLATLVIVIVVVKVWLALVKGCVRGFFDAGKGWKHDR